MREETRCCNMGYSFQLAARVHYIHDPTDRITHTTAFVTAVVEHWLEREIAQWVHHEGSIRPLTNYFKHERQNTHTHTHTHTKTAPCVWKSRIRLISFIPDCPGITRFIPEMAAFWNREVSFRCFCCILCGRVNTTVLHE